MRGKFKLFVDSKNTSMHIDFLNDRKWIKWKRSKCLFISRNHSFLGTFSNISIFTASGWTFITSQILTGLFCDVEGCSSSYGAPTGQRPRPKGDLFRFYDVKIDHLSFWFVFEQIAASIQLIMIPNSSRKCTSERRQGCIVPDPIER